MYKNYGDVDFFERGVLIDDNHTDSEFDMLRCEPYTDEEDLFMFAPLHVDVNDGWIEIEDVLDYAGIINFDPVEYAIACTDYYSWDNFMSIDYGATYDWQRMTKHQIQDTLFHSDYDIDPEVFDEIMSDYLSFEQEENA